MVVAHRRGSLIDYGLQSESFRIAILFMLAASVVAVAYIRSFPFTIADDAYIHFRIAEHYALLGAPYFNTGEPVMSTSSPVWTIVLSVIFLFHLRPEYAVFVVEICAIGASFTAAVLLFRDCGHGIKWACVGAVAVLMAEATAATGLMESPLAIAFLLLAALCAMRGNYLWGPLAALAACTRLEFCVLMPALGLSVALARQPLVKPALLAGVLLAAFGLWSLYYFGTIIPNTLAAKSAVYSLSRLGVFFSMVPGQEEQKDLSLAVVVAGVAVLLSSAVVPIRTNQSRTFADSTVLVPLALLTTGLLAFGAYILNRVLVFDWYVPLMVVPCMVGLLALSARVENASFRILRSAGMCLTFGPFVALAVWLTSREIGGRAYHELQPGGRVQRYMEVGSELNADPRIHTLLTSEIGGLGWTFRKRILDGAGLVSPEAIKFHPLKVPDERSDARLGAIPPGFARKENADAIVTYPQFAEALMRDPVLSEYACLKESPLPAQFGDETVWGSKYLLVCRRRANP